MALLPPVVGPALVTVRPALRPAQAPPAQPVCVPVGVPGVGAPAAVGMRPAALQPGALPPRPPRAKVGVAASATAPGALVPLAPGAHDGVLRLWKPASSQVLRRPSAAARAIVALPGLRATAAAPVLGVQRARVHAAGASLPSWSRRVAAAASPLVSDPWLPTKRARVDPFPAPGERLFSVPLSCRCCGFRLEWSAGAVAVYCERCCMVDNPHPRAFEGMNVALLPGLPRTVPPDFVAFVGCDAVEAEAAARGVTFPRHGVVVDDWRWAALRRHPASPDAAVLVCRYDIPLAALSRRLAAWLRFLALLRVSGSNARGVSLVAHEGDVSAAVLEMVLRLRLGQFSLAGYPAAGFPGDAHCFMHHELLLEAQTCRFASLPTCAGVPPPGSPQHSAYTELSSVAATYGVSPLQPEFFRRRYGWHPLGPWAFNSVRVGFSTHAPTFVASSPPRAPRARVGTDLGWLDGVVSDSVLTELRHGAFVDASTWPALARHPWFLTPKASGGFRGIANLSFGGDRSLNAATARPTSLLGPVRLASHSAIAARVAFLVSQRPGVSVHLFLSDKQRAFRILPVAIRELCTMGHEFAVPGGWLSLAHTRLAMGSASSMDTMCALGHLEADAAARDGFWMTSFVDDDICVEYCDRSARARDAVLAVASGAGWPLNQAKLAESGTPSTCQTVLGVVMDTVAGTAAITPQRRDKLRAALGVLLEPRGGTDAVVRTSPKVLASLTGKLQFVSEVVPFGRVFLRSLHAAAAQPHALVSRLGRILRTANPLSAQETIRVEGSLRRDLLFWRAALERVDEALFLPRGGVHTVSVSTDASKYGYGCVNWSSSEWAGGRWTEPERRDGSVAHWELTAVCLAAALWARDASGGVLYIACDNMSSVHAVGNMRAVDDRLHSLLVFLSLLQLRARFRLVLTHCRGEDNSAADAASRGRPLPANCEQFSKRKVPAALRGIGATSAPLWQRVASQVGAEAYPLESPTYTISCLSETFSAPRDSYLHWTVFNQLRLPRVVC